MQNSSSSVVYVVSQRFTERFKRKEMILCFTSSPLLTFLPVETSPKHCTAPHRAAGRLSGLTARAGSGSGRRVEEKRKSTGMITVAAAKTRSSSPVHRLISEALNALSTQQSTRLPRSRIHPSLPLGGGGAEEKKNKKQTSSSTPKRTERLTQPAPTLSINATAVWALIDNSGV